MTTPVIPTLCSLCANIIGFDDNRSLCCKAFPDGVPSDILSGQFDHRFSHSKDNGILFDPNIRIIKEGPFKETYVKPIDLYKNNSIKLNYRCPEGKFVPDSFKCGNTPEESKENYDKWKNEKSDDEKQKNSKSSNVSNDARSIVEKTKDEIKSDNVSKETYRNLKDAMESLRDQSSDPIDTNKESTKVTVENAAKKIADAKGFSGVSSILINQIKLARDDPDSLSGIIALEALRRDGFDTNGDKYDPLTSGEKSDFEEFDKQIRDDISQDGDMVDDPMNSTATRLFDLYHKESFLRKESKSGIVGTDIKTDLTTYIYMKKNGDTFEVSFERGMEDQAKRVAYLLSTAPKSIYNINNVIITDKRSPEDEENSKLYGEDFHTAAYCDMKDGVIVAWENSDDNMIKASTLYHELGHSLDSKLSKYSKLGNKYEISSSPEYKSVVDLDGKGSDGVSKYATSSMKVYKSTKRELAEDFAESIKLYLTKQDTFRKKYPNRCKFLDVIIGDNK